MSNWHWDGCHLEERASRVRCNDEGGLEECENKPQKNPTEDLSDPYIDDFLACQQLNHGLSGLLMAITRTDNNNTVIYQARVGDGETLSEEKGYGGYALIDQFWFDVEPSYIAGHRKKGVQHDRCEFGMLDGRGYGLTITQRDGETFASMNAMPKELAQEFKVVWVEGSPRFVGLVNGKECYMEKMYIKTQKRSLNPIPKILFVRVFGCGVEDGSKEMQEVKP